MRVRAIVDNLGLVPEDIVFISGDVDEVMSRSDIIILSHLSLTSPLPGRPSDSWPGVS